MAKRPPDELLYDSEASLRLVDRALTDLQVSSGELQRAIQESGSSVQNPSQLGLMDIPNLLLKAYTEINSVLANLRHSRDVLQQSTLDKLQHTNDKLREVSSATEVAATDMLDGLDRALALLDRLEIPTIDDGQSADEEVRASLRNELFSLMNCLQFQDITTQQLNYASSVLVEMESRLAELARFFDPDTLGLTPVLQGDSATPQAAFDPAATTADSEKRQALVDEIFTRR
jgi:hypothetical protein